MQTSPLGVCLIAGSLVLHSAWLVGALSAAIQRNPRPGLAPRTRKISILKPLAGNDDDLRDNLESFASLAHDDYEILFGVSTLADPAAAVARDVMHRHPSLRAQLVETDREAAVNPKVAQLIGLAERASGDVLVISDSNVRVGRDYLQTMERELDAAPNIGLVTSSFVGTGERSFGAALENLQLSAYVAPAVAASALLGGRSLTVGKSMAVTRAALEAIGGFASIGHVLAEDHLLGRRVREAGFRVRLTLSPVENRNVSCDVSRTLERHTRWAKMRRAIAPKTFVLEPLTDPLLVATAVTAAAPSRFTLLALLCILPWKILSSYAIAWLLRGSPLGLRYLPLELARSAMTFTCWARACASRRIEWRGHPFMLGRDSVIQPVSADTEAFALGHENDVQPPVHYAPMDERLFARPFLPKPARTIVFPPPTPPALLVERPFDCEIDTLLSRHDPPRTTLEGFVNRPDW